MEAKNVRSPRYTNTMSLFNLNRTRERETPFCIFYVLALHIDFILIKERSAV